MQHILSMGLMMVALTASVARGQETTLKWEAVCGYAADREMTIKTADGGTVQGFCMAVSGNELKVQSRDHKIVKIAREKVAALRVQRRKGHNLARLHRGIHNHVREAVDETLSPVAPIGLVHLPATLAWGAVAAPFCVIGDVFDHLGGSEVVVVR